jgi:energy-coupling factor transport system ATP-binding protein
MLHASGTFREGIHLVNGPTGSGKSTLALLMAGLLQPSSGIVYCEGIIKRMLSLQFPEYHITGSTLAEECASWGLDPSSILKAEGLDNQPDRDPLALSRGELKRLHLACVLAKDYDLLLLDEPFSALDCVQKENLSKRLSGNSSGITVIFTHEREFLPRINRFWEIRNGHLIDQGVQCPVR